MRDDFLWVEKYRPRKIEDVVLPASLKDTFSKFVEQDNVPNMILTGGPGVGKTTVARALLEELQCDYIVINGSMNGNIDTLRNEILNFASTVSFSGKRKYVILDEADYLNPNSTQPALRNFMEEFSKNCGFILTCNYKSKIIDPLHSRCSVVEFTIQPSDRPKLAAQFFKRACGILKAEGVENEPAVVAKVIEKHFPDWRRVLNELQRYSVTGKIDSGILTDFREVTISKLIECMKARNYTGVRAWVGENGGADQIPTYRKFYDMAAELFDPKSIPQLVLILARYQYQAAFAVDPEINMSACFAEIMVDCAWK